MTAHFGKSRAAPPEYSAASGRNAPIFAAKTGLARGAKHFMLACCPIDQLIFGFEASHVGAIEDHVGSMADASVAPIDLVEELGLSLSDEDARRRCLTLVAEGRGSERLLVGTEVAVREVVGRLQPLPSFIAGLGSRAAISGLIALQQRYLFMLDVSRLVENALARRASKVGP